MSIDAVPASLSLADLGSNVIDLFRKVEKALKQSADAAWPEEYFVAESERFELWAANMGLFVAGHGSLDYRVREAERLTQTLRRFMQDLINSLDDGEISPDRFKIQGFDESKTVLQMRPGASQENAFGLVQTSGGFPEPDSEAPVDDDDEYDEDEDEDEEGVDMELLLDSVRDPIDRLFKMSTKIRNPSTRLGSSKAAKHQQVDQETGVDFLEAIKGADIDYVKSAFLEYQKVKACQENHPAEVTEGPSGENDDGVWEPIRTVLAQERERERAGANSYLIERIAQANSRRRQQFAYWAKHRDTLHNHAKAYQTQKGQLPTAQRHKVSEFLSKLELTPGSVPSITTVTNLNIARLESSEHRSDWTISEYAPSTRQAADASVDFPPAPHIQRKTPTDKFFECPYCFFLCPREILADKAWKAHLIHDMRPYICTYEDCRNPGQLYDSRQDWVQHEESEHRKVWRCLEHSDQVFKRLETYKRHLQERHAGYISGEASLIRIIQASESASDIVDRACPVCTKALDTMREMEGHIALHLERFARFSLPRSVMNDDDVSNADSDKANKVDEEDSRNDDFDDRSKIYSDMDASEIRVHGQPPKVGSSSPLHGAGSIEGELQDFGSSAFDDKEELDRESGQDHQDIQQRTGVEGKSDPLTLGQWCADPGKYEEAEKSYREALEQREKALGPEHPDTLASMSDMARLLLGQRKNEEAEQMYLKILEIREKAPVQDGRETWVSMTRLGIALYNQGKYTECERIDREVLELRKRALGREHPDTLNSMSNLAVTLQELGKLEEAEKLGVEVTETRKQTLGPTDPDMLTNMSNLALVLHKLGRLEEAEKLCMEVLGIRKQTLGPAHPDTLMSMCNLALTLHELGRWEEAEKLGVEVMETRKQTLGSAHPSTLASMDDVSHTWHSLGRIADAIALMDSCVQLRGKVLGLEHPETASSIKYLDAWRAERVTK